MTTDKTKFFSKIVEPICDIEEGKKKGNYTWIYNWITPKTVPLEKVSGNKKVYLVPLTETVLEIEGITAFLKEKGLKPCVNAPQYMLGLMATTSQDELPNPSWIVAAEDTTSSVFAFEDGDPCFLGVDRRDGRRLLSLVFRRDGERRLSLVDLDGVWGAGRDWVFLAEDLENSDTSESMNLSSLDALTKRVEKLESLFNPELLHE